MKFIFGLGNPGKKYLYTRHNIGFLALDLYLQDHGIPIEKEKYHSVYAKARLFGKESIFVKPMTFMNSSGKSVAPFLKNLKEGSFEVIVIHDDVDIEEGSVRVKMGGGDGGHKGLRSIINETGGFSDFYRIRVGVGRPPAGVEVSDYVLEKASRALLKPLADRACDALDILLEKGYEKACNLINSDR